MPKSRNELAALAGPSSSRAADDDGPDPDPAWVLLGPAKETTSMRVGADYQARSLPKARPSATPRDRADRPIGHRDLEIEAARDTARRLTAAAYFEPGMRLTELEYEVRIARPPAVDAPPPSPRAVSRHPTHRHRSTSSSRSSSRLAERAGLRRRRVRAAAHSGAPCSTATRACTRRAPRPPLYPCTSTGAILAAATSARGRSPQTHLQPRAPTRPQFASPIGKRRVTSKRRFGEPDVCPAPKAAFTSGTSGGKRPLLERPANLAVMAAA